MVCENQTIQQSTFFTIQIIVKIEPLFKPSVTQPICQTTYVLNNKPFNYQTGLDLLITLFCYSNRHYICVKLNQ